MSNPGVFVRFSVEPVQNEVASREAGRPIFEDVEFVKLVVPGDKHNVIHRPVRPEDKQRFADAYAQWKKGETQKPAGTPLAEWPQIPRSQVEEMAHFEVRTVEQLAALSDSVTSRMGAAAALLRQRAKDYLLKAKEGEADAKLRTELEARDAAIAGLQAQIAELTAALAKSSKQPKSKE
jgi:hypothetical protein